MRQYAAGLLADFRGGQHALSVFGCQGFITGLAVHPDTHYGCVFGCHALSDQCADDTGQHVAHAGGGHTRIAGRVAPDRLTSLLYQRGMAFQHNGCAGQFNQSLNGRDSVGLDFVVADTKQACRFAWMGGQDGCMLARLNQP